MVMRNFIKGFALVLIIVVSLSTVMAITMTPSGDQTDSSNAGLPKTFTITSISDNATVTWYINGTSMEVDGPNVTSASYTNNSPAVGFWNVSAIAVNSSDSGDTNMTRWWWTVTAAVTPTNTTPKFDVDPTADNITDTSASIRFSVNQTSVKTRVYYGAGTLDTWSDWRNDTDSPITIPLSGLTNGTTYSYTVYAYNGSNQSLFTNSTPVLSFTTLNPSAPNATITDVTGITSSTANISFTVNQNDAKTGVKYGENEALDGGFVWKNESGSPRTIMLAGLTEGKQYFYSVYAYNGTNQSYSSNSSIQSFNTRYPAPIITEFYPSDTTPDITEGESQPLWVKVDQDVTVNWYLNNGSSPVNTSSVAKNVQANYTFSGSKGTYFISANASNANGSALRNWTLNVRSKTFTTGNRIWDGGRPAEFSLAYTWNPMSFSGFYYDLKDDVGNESIKITLDSYSDRTINEDDLVYTTTPQEVTFGYSGFGKYQVIGFMAEKYFAGYTINTTSINTKPSTTFDGKSTIAQGQLHKVLFDDDTKRTISVGGTLTLQEGYVLKATDIDTGARTMLLTLLKDGSEVDTMPLSAGETYVFTKKVGSVSDLPLIMIRFDSVFSGREVQAAFLRGVFQISESATTVKNGNQFGRMKVTSVTQDKIEMKNSDSDISLSAGSTEDVMGNIKIKVADNSSVVRYALTVEKTGSFEVRSSIYKQDSSNPITEWSPYNFGMNIGETSVGFYYDLDDGIGNESLKLAGGSLSGSTISDEDLVYSTTPEEVTFGYSGFGKYGVIGFMADKYFAGYSASADPPNPQPSVDFSGKSTIAQGQLHKVLIDDDTKRTISVGGTLTLQEGYVLKATDIDASARTMLLTLLKDGSEVDTTPLSAEETYVYTKKVGAISELPLIMVRFDSVFAGREVEAAFLRGLFQVSESATSVKSGDKFGVMRVTSVNANKIEMKNDGSIGLDRNKDDELMGNIRLKVADSDTLRFYFAVDVTPEMIANQLVIDAPAKIMAGDNITIKVTAGGSAVDNATLTLESELGNTGSDGVLSYTLPKTLKGTYNITATKLGYEKATKSIEVEQYIDLRLSMDVPAKIVQFDPIQIKVTYNTSPMPGATVKFDDGTIGTTDNDGLLNFSPQISGTHTLSASKTGYITVSRDVEIIVPYSEYKALDINITPNVVTPGQEVVIRANITNSGTKADTLPVDLLINGSAVENRTVALGRGETKEINFTGNLDKWMIEEVKPGNYSVEVLGQKGLLEAREEPFNLLLIAGILTVLGSIVIYVLTAKNKLSVEVIKQNLNAEAIKGNAEAAGRKLKEAFRNLSSKIGKPKG